MNDDDLTRLIVELTVSECIKYISSPPGPLLALAKRCKIDPAKVKKDLAADDILLALCNNLLGRTLVSGNKNKDLLAAGILRVWNGLRRGKPLKHINNAFRMDGATVRAE